MSIKTQIDRIKNNLSGAYDAVSAKGGTVPSSRTSANLANAIKSIPLGTDTSDATAAAGDILSGKTAYAKGSKVTGSIASKTASNLTASGATVTVPAGYYPSQVSKSIETATQATPTISVNSTGKITASATQSAGYVAAGTQSATKQLTIVSAKTVTPGTSEQTAVVAGRYATGAVKVAGDANLVAANIRSGVSIFGVEGIAQSGLPFTNSYQFCENPYIYSCVDYFGALDNRGRIWFNGTFRFAWIKFSNGLQVYLTPTDGTSLHALPNSTDVAPFVDLVDEKRPYVDGDEDGWNWIVDPSNLLKKAGITIVSSLFIGSEI